MRISYEQAKRDHAALWAIGPANDMSGGYVDQEDLDRLLKSPTKTTARDCFVSQINYWFQSGIETNTNNGDFSAVENAIKNNPEVREIAERYGYA